MKPMGLRQGALAETMGVQRKRVNELCSQRRAVTAPTALVLARVLGNSPDFWLNVQRLSDLWEAMHSPGERDRIKRARPLKVAALHTPPTADGARREFRLTYCAPLGDVLRGMLPLGRLTSQ